jgi:uncharacterized protein with von Willebrand factor type A (vWA) domain
MPSQLRVLPDVSQQLLARMADFTLALRDNAFAVGLKEGEDAARVLASDVAARSATLRAALKSLFCARRSDWLKFDDIFDACWLGRGMRRVVQTSAHATAAKPAELHQIAGSDTPDTGLGIRCQLTAAMPSRP